MADIHTYIENIHERGEEMDSASEILARYFGYTSFRPGQEGLIKDILAGRDVLGIMPTGGGKSLCYQVPALLLPGVTLVISPLISLMADQVASLNASGVPAVCLNSTLTDAEFSSTMRGILAGKYKLLYVAPERLESASFRDMFSRLEIPFVAVDEAHCVSQWGQDFRPSYLKIAPTIERISPRPTVAAFTATATERVRDDIKNLLRLNSPEVVVTGFDRPNLFFDVRRPHKKDEELERIIHTHKGKPGIIYCSTRKKTERVCEKLLSMGVRAERYHAGLPDKERAEAQRAFQYDEAEVMVATNAFGMGIDKSNVGWVLHYNMPKSLDEYYQEAGRAGRDGSPADCILLYNSQDIATAKLLLQNDEGIISDSDKQRLDAMVGYCHLRSCLRGYILDYFGEEHKETCGNCGNCRAEYRFEDITREAQMILSCVERIRGRLGYNLGRAAVSDVLRARLSETVIDKGLARLTTFGLMEGVRKSRLMTLIDELISQNLLMTNEFGALACTSKAAGVLFHDEKVTMPIKVYNKRKKSSAKSEPSGETAKKRPKNQPAVDNPEVLYARLRNLRARIARENAVPAYVIFSNATLQAIALAAPDTLDELREISGVGNVKLERYGAQIVSEVQRFKRG